MSATPMYFRVYVGKDGDHYWSLHAEGNRKTVADSGEGYKHKADCIDAAKLIQSGAQFAIIVDDTNTGGGSSTGG